jgi:glycosyltransferase involved in cell wall biosynthesis
MKGSSGNGSPVKPRRFAVAIPAYQAAGTIEDVVRGTLRLCGDVLVVDDGSTDQTAARAAAAGARVLRHARNLGKGRALRTAFDDLFDGGFDTIVTVDADGQHLPEEIPRLLDAADADGGADLVIGSRAHLFEAMHPMRRTSNRSSSRAISWFAGQRLEDVQSGFRLYTRRVIDRAGFPEPRFEAESAIVVRAVRLGLEVRCVRISLGEPDGRATSHYRPLVDSLRIAGAVVRARLQSTVGSLRAR